MKINTNPERRMKVTRYMTGEAYQYNDGGRAEAGFKGTAGDCAARAMAIALGLSYKEAYDEVAQANKNHGYAKSARNGVYKEVFSEVLERHGWVWHSAPKFEGRKARAKDMPAGTVIARQAGHYCAVIDGVIQDIFDSSHKMVYGYWALKVNRVQEARDRVVTAKLRIVNIETQIKHALVSGNSIAMNLMSSNRKRLGEAEMEFDMALDDLIIISKEEA
tara:strand:- start:8906 stop:9562 length:657 start_codon:yes stop_codon:yes gene_type:complete